MTGKLGLQFAAKFWEFARPILRPGARQVDVLPRPQSTFFNYRRFHNASLPKPSKYVASRGFASGLLAFGVPSKATETTQVMSCSTATIDNAISSPTNLKHKDRKSVLLAKLTRISWRRNICTDSRSIRGLRTSRRHQSSRANGRNSNHNGSNKLPKRDGNGDSVSSTSGKSNGNGKQQIQDAGKIRLAAEKATTIAKQVARDHGFMDRLPHMHRPTKDELLAAASSFWQRLKIRFKWLTIRQIRPFNMDEISAFFSWFVVGQFLWIILGTTTFFSLAIWTINTVFAQEYLAGVVGNYLTKQTGVRVVFESAIVPRWNDGCISFKNVFVSRRPGPVRGKNVQKGSSMTAAAAAAATAVVEEEEAIPEPVVPEEDQNYTQFDLTIDTVNVTISLAKWMNGKGLLVDVDIKGVRGVIDRTHVHWTPGVDPRALRHVHSPGDFEIQNFKLEDLLVTIHQPHDFRPFSVSIFSMDLPQLRKQWLFYDLLSASNISGSFDESLFTIHPRQTHGPTMQHFNDAEEDRTEYPWKKTSRIRIDGLNIDHVNRGMDGPLSWIHSGNLSIVADVMFPTDTDEGITKLVHDFMLRMESSVASRREKLAKLVSGEEAPGNEMSLPFASLNSLEEEEGGYLEALAPSEDVSIMEPAPPPPAEPESSVSEDRKFMMMDLHMQLNDAKARVPLFNTNLSYTNNALVRPIVGFINSRRTIIPVNCRVLKRISEFDGSWTVYDSGLMDDISAETYDAFVKDIADADIKRRRMRAVGLWSLQVFMNAFLAAMAGTMIA